MQLSANRHFLHEHPSSASSWRDPWVEALLRDKRVHVVTGDQCMYGLVTPDENGHMTPAKKPTKFATSSIHMARRLSTRCSGQHSHQHLMSGRAAAAAFYQAKLVAEILRGIRDTADPEMQVQEEEEKKKPLVHECTVRAGSFHGFTTDPIVSAIQQAVQA